MHPARNSIVRSFLIVVTAIMAFIPLGRAQSPVAPSFRWLNQGEVKPAGWIKAQMERDLREGSIGHLDELAPQANSDIFVTGRNAPGKPNPYSQAGEVGEIECWGNGETEGNWRTGYMRTAYLVGDKAAKRKADAYVQHILQSQDKDGYIGIYSPEIRYPQSALGSELWTQTTMFRGLLAYYDFSGDAAVLKAVERAVQLDMSKYGPGKMTAFHFPNYDCGVSHGLMMVDVLKRLYDLTGDPAYRDFGLWLYQDFSTAPDWVAFGGMDYWGDGRLPALLDVKKPLVGHGATTCEHIRVPAWAYMVSGNPDYRRAYENALIKLTRISFPSGATIAQEDSRGMAPDPTTTFYEFCALKELMTSHCSGLAKFGKPELGDQVEKLMFNAIQGSRAPGGKGVTYCTRDNRYAVDGAVGNRDKFSPPTVTWRFAATLTSGKSRPTTSAACG